MQGRITVNGIRFHAFHGLTKLERQIGVRHRVDIAMKADIEKAAETDRIENTVDYREIHDIVIRIGRQNSFYLIETLAVRIAKEIMDRCGCDEVRVSVQKETPVLDGMVDSVGVEVTLEKEPAAP
jgi:dihydroneopterin aldolase